MDYQQYRWFYTSSGKLVICGKSGEQNETLVKDFIGKDNMICHTKEPGSPFCIILDDDNKNTEKDFQEMADFCLCFSQQWKKLKSHDIHFFTGKDAWKGKEKQGTFNVKKVLFVKKGKLELFLTIQQGKLRAVPFPGKIKITPGKLDKDKAAQRIKKVFNFSLEEIKQAIPSTGIEIK